MLSSKRMMMITTMNAGVPFSEFAMLMHIYRLSKADSSQTGVRVARIKDQTHISLPAVSQQLKSLEQKGLIVRNTKKEDRRITLVSLTPSGSDILKGVKKSTDEIIGQLIDAVGENEIKEYIKISADIMKAFDEIHHSMPDTDCHDFHI
jgi:DNA-binding MarR family transcriptional regulator